eukprot:gene7618-9440_t
MPFGEEGVPVVGFYATRSVSAANARQAEQAAVELLLAEWRRPPLALANRGAGPRLTIEAMHAHAWWQHLLFKNRGHTFYPADEPAAVE